jgi:hypothetical protein
LRLQTSSSPASNHERESSRAIRHVQPLCQVGGCRARACRAVEIQLPAAWEASRTYTVLTLVLGACGEHARELERRVAAMIDARVDLYNLLAIVEAAAARDAELRARLAASERRQSAHASSQTALELVMAERARQVGMCGWTAEHDDQHGDGELAKAAATYITPAMDRWMTEDEACHRGWVPALWPWDGNTWKPRRKDRVRELVKGCALAVAELDRLLRKQTRQAAQSGRGATGETDG